MSRLRALLSVLALGLLACGSPDEGDEPDANTSGVDGAAGTVDAPSGTPDAPSGTPDAASPDAAEATGHTDNNNGVMHRPGKEDPLTNCVACHGADLTGGDGPSCYSCHDNDDHSVNRGGHMHLSGSQSTCTRCHGPSNSGGLGPACNDCH